MRPRLIAAALVIAASLVGACSAPVPVGSAVSLAKAGQDAATQMRQSTTLSAATYATLEKAVAFDAGFANDLRDPATQDLLNEEAQIQAALSAYGGMLDKLASAYAALGALAAYDANGNFSSAASSLCDAAGNLIRTVSRRRRLPAAICPEASRQTGLVARAVQGEQVRAASDAIAAVLQAVIPVLADPSRRNLIVMNNELVQRLMVSAAKELYIGGAFSCGAVIAALGSPLNLAPVNGVDAVVSKHPNLARGCLNVVTVEAQDSATAPGVAYDKSIEALKALAKQHENLKAGIPLDLDGVNAIVAGLQGLATKQQSPEGM